MKEIKWYHKVYWFMTNKKNRKAKLELYKRKLQNIKLRIQLAIAKLKYKKLAIQNKFLKKANEWLNNKISMLKEK